jgi:hypothetical protein
VRLPWPAFLTLTACALLGAMPRSQTSVVPRFWDREQLEDYELPLATPSRTPEHVSREYYYQLPERPLYRSFPVFAPGREPDGYLDALRLRGPEVIPVREADMRSDADWAAAGQLVFEQPIGFNGPIVTLANLRDPEWFRRLNIPVTSEGIVPFVRYVVRQQGRVDVGQLACAMCHTRVMPDGTAVQGAQGNFPFDQVFAATIPAVPPPALPLVLQSLVGTPWDEAGTRRLQAMEPAELQRAFAAVPPGVIVRQGTSLFAPPAIPDLIGIEGRRYFDKTGLGRHRSAADLMRYAALNQTLDVLASYGGFVPDAEDGRTLAPPGQSGFAGSRDRYSDAQLYALARFVYALTAPSNPNAFDARATRGAQVFASQGCARCHTPPLYTNNRLVAAEGFTPPADHTDRYGVMAERVGTDPALTMATRRGTGYYKVPSLRGVWYRGPFEHSGSVATLEDWFDPARVRDDYRPTGFAPYDGSPRPVRGHRFGLSLSAEDRAALIAFLKTL